MKFYNRIATYLTYWCIDIRYAWITYRAARDSTKQKYKPLWSR